jgi:anaerobic ribonucleoside-triphosphate reductase activating protein
MNYLSKQITFSEIPDEVCLSYLITGCTLKCPGCHSVDSWNPKAGQPLTLEVFTQNLIKYQDWITTVLFMGGEWHQDQLIHYLRISLEFKMKTALFTGLKSAPQELINNLTYLKTEPYIRDLGGLASHNTNQKLINIKTGKQINFIKEVTFGTTQSTPNQ